MHDQYLTEICRHAKHAHEQKHRELRKRQKRAIDVMLATTDLLLEWPDDQRAVKADLWQQVDERSLRGALATTSGTFSGSKNAATATYCSTATPVCANILPPFSTCLLPPNRAMSRAPRH